MGNGMVKEHIETEGLGMILCKDMGLVLFHLDSVWIDGKPCVNRRISKEKLYPGSEVSFLVRSFQGEEYSSLSEDKVIHQAVAVWYGSKPDNVLKTALGEEHTRMLEEHRKTFMLYVKGEVFIRVSLMRVAAEVAGYLTDSIGILEYVDDHKDKHNILFHADDVRIYKKDVGSFRGPCKKNLPVGCSVKVDARRVHIDGVKNVQYQALVVIAGAWPPTPFPSILQGGKGTYAPDFEIPNDATYYYLELPLESRCKKKVDNFRSMLKESKGKIEYDWRDVEYIRDKQDYLDWKHQMGGTEFNDRPPPGRRDGPRECLDTFKSCKMPEEELAVKVVTKEVEGRTWYTPEAWQHGGLRLKKEEPVNEDDPSPSPIPTKRPRLTGPST